MIDPAECRRLAAEIQLDIDSGPEVNPYEITWGAASAIASALTDAADLAGKYADAKAIADLFCEERATLTAERDAARAEVERLRAGIREVLDRGSSFARDHSLRAALRKLIEVSK